MKLHKKYIKRCIQISKNGWVAAAPNPSVGAVIVVDDKIIGEGFTSAYGGKHAEVNAINAVKDKLILKKATLYVSLEPCSHFGKTPPCADLIVKYKIPNVVIGMIDPNEKVAGAGIKKLVEAGIHVTVGVLEQDCFEVNKQFFTFHQKKRPYIILKWAKSQDGFIAPDFFKNNTQKREPIWITNEFSRQLVHKWRSETQAILLGTQTVVDDNPQLSTRSWSGTNPIRIIIDQNNRISKDSYIFDNQVETIILDKNKIDFNENIVVQISQFLYNKKIQSVLIEGGSKMLQTFIDSGIWDEARVFRGGISFETGLLAPKLKAEIIKKTTILEDELLIYKNYD